MVENRDLGLSGVPEVMVPEYIAKENTVRELRGLIDSFFYLRGAHPANKKKNNLNPIEITGYIGQNKINYKLEKEIREIPVNIRTKIDDTSDLFDDFVRSQRIIITTWRISRGYCGTRQTTTDCLLSLGLKSVDYEPIEDNESIPAVFHIDSLRYNPRIGTKSSKSERAKKISSKARSEAQKLAQLAHLDEIQMDELAKNTVVRCNTQKGELIAAKGEMPDIVMFEASEELLRKIIEELTKIKPKNISFPSTQTA